MIYSYLLHAVNISSSVLEFKCFSVHYLLRKSQKKTAKVNKNLDHVDSLRGCLCFLGKESFKKLHYLEDPDGIELLQGTCGFSVFHTGPYRGGGVGEGTESLILAMQRSDILCCSVH